MKIANKFATVLAVAALTLTPAAAFADSGMGDGGTNSHYPPMTGDTGCGDSGSSHYPSCDSVVAAPAKKKATGQVARLTTVFNKAGETVKTRYIFKNVRATQITITTVGCNGKVLKKVKRGTNPAAAGIWSYSQRVNTPAGAGMSVVKFSQPGKKATKKYFHLSSCM